MGESSWKESACEQETALSVLLNEQIHASLFPITSESPYSCAGKDSPIKQSTDFSGFFAGEMFPCRTCSCDFFLSLTLKRCFL